MSIGHHQLDAGEASGEQITQEARPERLGLRRADMQADDFPFPIRVDGHRDYRRSGAHLAFNEYGSAFSTAVSTSTRLRNYTTSEGATSDFVTTIPDKQEWEAAWPVLDRLKRAGLYVCRGF